MKNTPKRVRIWNILTDVVIVLKEGNFFINIKIFQTTLFFYSELCDSYCNVLTVLTYFLTKLLLNFQANLSWHFSYMKMTYFTNIYMYQNQKSVIFQDVHVFIFGDVDHIRKLSVQVTLLFIQHLHKRHAMPYKWLSTLKEELASLQCTKFPPLLKKFIAYSVYSVLYM